ncbi:NTP transferase domain-containing protein [Halobaculum sp. CBA1158]|uniref:NTP transferase domain-containing protein n=1 Tax=Halobaculum sp. CBA1158 TaxID=2904243 RepID=UPI001F48F8F4|nr:NTP transferase domain-containing protein [Halobaculum sp. CBA1158]UIP00292.1 NTP transferase domain-containing protein [Halobaculum sp. CBA1158]
MDALVMCGGRGTRLGADGADTEKPLVLVDGVAMVERVRRALADSRVDRVHAAVSPDTPATRERLADRPDVSVVDAPGDGYVADLGYALARVDRPVLTVAADLPLLSADAVDRALAAAGDGDGGDANDAGNAAGDASLAAYVPVALKRDLGVSVDPGTTRTLDGREVVPTGLNVVGGSDDDGDDSDGDGDDGDRDGDGDRDDGGGTDERSLVLADEGLAVNVNRPRDLRVAEALLRRERDGRGRRDRDRPETGSTAVDTDDTHDTDTHSRS